MFTYWCVFGLCSDMCLDSTVICVYSTIYTPITSTCRIWMSHSSCRICHVTCEWVIGHVPYEWVVSHMNESCPKWMSHVPNEWVMSQMNESCPKWMSHVPYEWVMSHMNLQTSTMRGRTNSTTISTGTWRRSVRELNSSALDYQSTSARTTISHMTCANQVYHYPWQVSCAKEPYKREDILQKWHLLFVLTWHAQTKSTTINDVCKRSIELGDCKYSNSTTISKICRRIVRLSVTCANEVYDYLDIIVATNSTTISDMCKL